MNNILNTEVPMPAPSATMLDRLKFLVDSSHRSQAQFSRLIDIDPSSLSRLLGGRMPITKQFANRLAANLGVSLPWFLRGEGVPFPKADGPAQLASASSLSYPAKGERPKGTPVYDIDATAGSVPVSRMFAQDRIIGYLDMPQIDPSAAVVRVSGLSMSPVVPDGSYIAIREIQDTSIIMWGAIYLVQLDDYRMVKYVRKHPTDPEMLILHSENPDFDDIEVPRAAVRRLFIVESIINWRAVC